MNWECEVCHRMLKSNFCPNCGTKKPKNKGFGEIELYRLKHLLDYYRLKERSLHNQADTNELKGWNIDKYKRAEKKHKETADSLEFAIDKLSKKHV